MLRIRSSTEPVANLVQIGSGYSPVMALHVITGPQAACKHQAQVCSLSQHTTPTLRQILKRCKGIGDGGVFDDASEWRNSRGKLDEQVDLGVAGDSAVARVDAPSAKERINPEVTALLRGTAREEVAHDSDAGRTAANDDRVDDLPSGGKHGL